MKNRSQTGLKWQEGDSALPASSRPLRRISVQELAAHIWFRTEGPVMHQNCIEEGPGSRTEKWQPGLDLGNFYFGLIAQYLSLLLLLFFSLHYLQVIWKAFIAPFHIYTWFLKTFFIMSLNSHQMMQLPDYCLLYMCFKYIFETADLS